MFLIASESVSTTTRQVAASGNGQGEKLSSRGVGFESFVESKNLTSRSGRHGGANERVSETVFDDLLLEFSPIPEVGRSYTPKVELKFTTGSGRTYVILEIWVPTVFTRVRLGVLLSHVARRFDSCVVDGFEDLQVELTSFGRIERESESHESVSETLYSDSDRSVTHVAVLCLLDGVVDDVDNSVQVESNCLDDVVKFLEVVNSVFDEGRESDRSQVADGAID